MTWQETATDYYKNHPTLNDENRLWLRENVDLDAQLLQDMTRDQILQSAIEPKTHAFSAARLERTLVWQTLARIICGDLDSPAANIRTIYYMFSDPLFTQFNLYKEVQADPGFQSYTRALTESFPYDRYSTAELVGQPEISKGYISDLTEDVIRDFVTQQVFRYQGPFLFIDDNAQYKLLGLKNSSMVFVTEKRGMFGVCRRYANLYGVTVMASQGNPSWVTLEYLADQLHAKKDKNLRLATLCDYDPGGYNIALDFKHKFETYGFKIKNHTMITSLDLFSQDTLDNKAEDLSHLSKGKQTQADEWFAETNGIHGRKAGIHVNLADPKLIDHAVKVWFDANVHKDDKPSATGEAKETAHAQ
jgi:hypothetical protein